MALPVVKKINEASRAIWPQVSTAFATSVRSMAELAEISEEVFPRIETYIDRGPEPHYMRRRKISEETVWALANAGWLRTGGERQVVLAAKKMADAIGDTTLSDAEYQAIEDQLITAVGNLPEHQSAPTQEAAS